MTARSRPTRRQFLATAGRAAAAGVVASKLPVARSAHAAGSDTIGVGLVGCGGRGRGAVANALDAGPDLRLTAIADVFSDQVSTGLNPLRQKYAQRADVPSDRVFIGFDAYQRVLESPVDLVILAAPPGFRPIHFEAAVEAGKHVFLEKSFAVDTPGYRRLIAANDVAKRKSLKVGAGLQSRHQNNYIETVRRVRAGDIGEVRVMEVTRRLKDVRHRWAVRNKTSEMEYQLKNWPSFVWLGGDTIVDYLIHNLDCCHWIKGGPPQRARGHGGRIERDGPDHGDIFDHFRVEYTYDDGSRILAETDLRQSVTPEYREHVTGTAGTADLKSGRIEGKLTWRYTGPRNNAYQDELTALISAIRSDIPYNEVDAASTSNLIAIMGRMAAYEGREITWDEAADSNEAYLPERYAWDADPPSLPDKFGDYIVPARGKLLS